MPKPFTVVIPTHNRQDAVAGTVQCLLTERNRALSEIIVVDDGSHPPISLEKNFGVRLLRTPGVERSRARNLGAISAESEHVIFVDDDISVGVDFVETHATAMTDFGDIIGVGKISLPPESARFPFGRFRALIEEPKLNRGRGVVSEQNFCTAANMSMRRNSFVSLGGFDPSILSGEDQDLALRFTAKNGRIVYLPEADVIHRDSVSGIAAYCRRHEWGARAMAPLLRRYPEREESKQRLRFERGFHLRGLLSMSAPAKLLLAATGALERSGANDIMLFAMYRIALGLHLFRGFRQGLATVKESPPMPMAIDAAIAQDSPR